MRLRRRVIPLVIALAFGLAAFSPVVSGWPSDPVADKWTLFAVAWMFAFKAGLFWWMRQRMHDGIRRLTRFGAALVDFFTGVVFCDLALVVVIAVAYWYARSCACAKPTSPYWLRLSDRSVLIAGVALVISTGGAVAFEMRRAYPHLNVHENEPKEE
jgi:apolipoprotein N-acyltransferase